MGDYVRTLERVALAGLFAATCTTMLLVARNGLVPKAGTTGFGLAFWGWLVAAYEGVAVALFLVLSGVALALRRPGLLRFGVAALAVAFPVFAVALNRRPFVFAFGLVAPDPFRWLVPVLLVACLAGLACVAAWPLHRPGLPRLAALLVAASTWLTLSPPTASTASAVAPEAKPAAAQSQRFVLVGLDGGDWRYMGPLMARGDLPHLAALREKGAWGNVETLRPTLSPAIWTTVATGVAPKRHGVRGFTTVRLRGIDETLPSLHPLQGLGVRQLLDYLRSTRRIDETPISSATRRVPAYWNIASALGAPLAVVNWWGTAPAEAVLGYVVSERAYHEELVARGRRPAPPGLTHPESLYATVGPMIVLPDQVRHEDTRPFMDVTPEEFEAMRVRHPSPLTGIEHEFTYFLSMFETDRRIALHLLKEGRRAFGVPPDLLVLFRLVDKTSHTALRFSELVEHHGPATPDELRKFGRVVTGAYRAVDAAVGEIQRAFPEANVVVVSDHGFALESDPAQGVYNHTHAPEGIFLAAGPAFRPGKVERISVYDVMPLLLYLKGFPQADDIAGTLPTAALDPALLARQPVRRVATYGDRHAPRPAGGTAEADAEMMERLRALGYLQ